MREGAAVKDFENPDRIIIGTASKKAEEILTSLIPVKSKNRQADNDYRHKECGDY